VVRGTYAVVCDLSNIVIRTEYACPVTKPTSDQLAVWRQLQWANALIMGRFRRDLAEFDLTIEEFDVLVHLAWVPDGRLPLRELTASMVLGNALSRSGLTRMLDRMEHDGLIRRELNKSDRRRFDVALTRKGRARFEQVWPPHEEGIQHYFVDPLTERDLDALRRILGKLIQLNEAIQHDR
jgi:DNA-binding MarR family transcriptional regulator